MRKILNYQDVADANRNKTQIEDALYNYIYSYYTYNHI